MNVGLDMDEVLVELMKGFFDFHNHSYGTNYSKEDLFSYDFQEVFGWPAAEIEQKLLQFFDSDYFRNLDLVPGAEQGTRLLAPHHKLSVITARPKIVAEPTRIYLAERLPNRFTDLTLTNQWHGKGKKQRKSAICKEKGIEIMVEDSPKHAYDCASQGITVLLLARYRWNRNYEPELPNIIPVKSWEEITDKIFKYEEDRKRE